MTVRARFGSIGPDPTACGTTARTGATASPDNGWSGERKFPSDVADTTCPSLMRTWMRLVPSPPPKPLPASGGGGRCAGSSSPGGEAAKPTVRDTSWASCSLR